LPERNSIIEKSAQEWLDALFSEFELFADQFNASALGTNLHVVIMRPKKTFRTVDRRDPSSERYEFTCYQGHLTTHTWALLARSYFDTLQIFIVPQEKVLGLELNSIGTIPPFMELKSAVNGDQVAWALNGKVLALEMISPIARELFGDLVRVASGSMHESELFQDPSCPLVLGASVAIGHKNESLNSQTTSPTVDASVEPDVCAPSELLRRLQLWQFRKPIIDAIHSDIATLNRVRQEYKDLQCPVQLQKLLQGYAAVESASRELFESIHIGLEETKRTQV
jgi:hypothetical protein